MKKAFVRQLLGRDRQRSKSTTELLLSCAGKLYSAVLNSRLKTYLEINDILIEEQNGFRKGRSTIEHISTLTTVLKNNLKKGRNSFCCFIDFQKAFDRVDRHRLFVSLMSVGKLYWGIKSYYHNTTCRFRVNGYRYGPPTRRNLILNCSRITPCKILH